MPEHGTPCTCAKNYKHNKITSFSNIVVLRFQRYSFNSWRLPHCLLGDGTPRYKELHSRFPLSVSWYTLNKMNSRNLGCNQNLRIYIDVLLRQTVLEPLIACDVVSGTCSRHTHPLCMLWRDRLAEDICRWSLLKACLHWPVSIWLQ